MSPSSRVWLGFVLLVALGARILCFWQLSDAPFFDRPMGGMDQATYLESGAAIADGDLIGRKLGTTFAPAYAYWVALLRLLGGERVWPIYALQILLGLITTGLVYGMGRRWFGNLGAVAAGLLYGLFGPVLFYEFQILEASLAAFAVALGLYAHQRLAWGAPAAVWAGLAGLSLGLVIAGWPRGVVLVVPSVWSLWRQTRSRSGSERSAALASYCIALLLLVAPALLRAHALDGSLVPSKREVRELLLGNLLDKADPGWAGSASFTEFSRSRPMTLPSVASELGDRILRAPADYAALWGRKVAETFGDYEIPSNTAYALSAERSLLLRMPWSHFALLLGLGVLGMAAAWRQRARLPILWLLAAALGTFLLLPDSRSRLPWIPILALLAGGGVAALAGGLRSAGSDRVLRWAALAGAAALIGSLLAAPDQRVRGVDYFNAAIYYLDRDDVSQVLELPIGDERERRLNQLETDLRQSRNLALWLVPPCGRPERMQPERIRAVMVAALSRLNAIHQDQGRLSAARADVDGILWLVPGDIEQWMGSALLRKFEQLPLDLVREFQIAAILSPNDPRVHENLAIAFGSMAKVRSPSRSQFHIRRMLELNPNHPLATSYQDSLKKVTAILMVARARVDMGELQSRAYQYAAQGSVDAAIESFREVFKLDTSNVSDFEQVAGLYLAKDDLRSAADCLLDAAVMEPDRSGLLVQLADLYERIGDPLVARELLVRANSLGGDSERAQPALARLNQSLEGRPWVPPGGPTPCGPAPGKKRPQPKRIF